MVGSIRKVYLRIGRFSSNCKNAVYQASATPPDETNMPWFFSFDDNYSGIKHIYYWSGRAKDEPYRRE